MILYAIVCVLMACGGLFALWVASKRRGDGAAGWGLVAFVMLLFALLAGTHGPETLDTQQVENETPQKVVEEWCRDCHVERWPDNDWKKCAEHKTGSK